MLRPDPAVLLFDGDCTFCRAQTKRLLRWVPAGAIETLDLNDPAVPTRFPDLTREALLTAMHLVAPDGRVYQGIEAAVRALATRPVLGRIALLYYLPGIRQLADAAYAFLARRRHRLSAADCPDGACGIHRRGGVQRPPS